MSANKNHPEWLSTGEVAEIFKIGRTTVINWANDGKLPHRKTLGGRRRFYEPTMRKILDEQTYIQLKEAPVGDEG